MIIKNKIIFYKKIEFDFHLKKTKLNFLKLFRQFPRNESSYSFLETHFWFIT